MRLGTPRRRRVRTKPQSINYDSPVPQCRPPNPHRKLPHQHPYPAQNNQIGCSSSPSPPEGVKGRGGSGGKRITQKSCTQPSPNPLTTTVSFPNLGEQTRTAASRTKNPSPARKNQIGCSSSPSPPEGVKGRGGSGGVNSGEKKRRTNQPGRRPPDCRTIGSARNRQSLAAQARPG